MEIHVVRNEGRGRCPRPSHEGRVCLNDAIGYLQVSGKCLEHCKLCSSVPLANRVSVFTPRTENRSELRISSSKAIEEILGDFASLSHEIVREAT